MALTLMLFSPRMSIDRVMLVTKIACAALSIDLMWTNVGVMACALVRTMATCGEIVVPIVPGKVPNA